MTDAVVGPPEADVQLGDDEVLAEAGEGEVVPDGDTLVPVGHAAVELLQNLRRVVVVRVRV